jgi:hypothetical protein
MNTLRDAGDPEPDALDPYNLPPITVRVVVSLWQAVKVGMGVAVGMGLVVLLAWVAYVFVVLPAFVAGLMRVFR